MGQFSMEIPVLPGQFSVAINRQKSILTDTLSGTFPSDRWTIPLRTGRRGLLDWRAVPCLHQILLI